MGGLQLRVIKGLYGNTSSMSSYNYRITSNLTDFSNYSDTFKKYFLTLIVIGQTLPPLLNIIDLITRTVRTCILCLL